MSLTREEQEVAINFTAADKIAEVCATHPVYIRKLDKLVETYPDTYRETKLITLADGTVIGKRYEFPIRLLRFVKPPSEKLTEASRIKWEKSLQKNCTPT